MILKARHVFLTMALIPLSGVAGYMLTKQDFIGFILLIPILLILLNLGINASITSNR